MRPLRRARRRRPPIPAPAPMPAFAPVDSCETCAACDVLLEAAVVLVEEEERLEDVGDDGDVIVLDAAAVPELNACEVVEGGV